MDYINYNRNYYIGNYFDITNNKSVFIIPKDNNLMLVNLENNFLIILELETNKCYYFSFREIYDNTKDILFLLDFDRIDGLINIPGDYTFEFKNLEEKKYTELEINIFGRKIKLKKIYPNINIANMIIENKNTRIVQGGTREVLLLDNIVIKDTDPTCSILCELLTNYFAKSKNINVGIIYGLLEKNGNLYLCEKKYEYIDWKHVSENIFYLVYFLNKWDDFVKQINKAKILGDYNLGNILLDNNNLVVTDFNGNNEKIILDSGLIINKETANNYITRLTDYLFNPRINDNIDKIKINIELMMKNILNSKINILFLKKVLKNIDSIHTGHINATLQNVIFSYGNTSPYSQMSMAEVLITTLCMDYIGKYYTFSPIFVPVIWTILKRNGYYFPDEWASFKELDFEEKHFKIIEQLVNLEGYSDYILTVLTSEYNFDILKGHNYFESEIVKAISKEKSKLSKEKNFMYLKTELKYFKKYYKYKIKYLKL